VNLKIDSKHGSMFIKKKQGLINPWKYSKIFKSHGTSRKTGERRWPKKYLKK
jgi:hypothetical protein